MRHSPLAFFVPEVVAKRKAEISGAVSAAGAEGRLAVVGSAALPAKCARGLTAVGARPQVFIEYDATRWGRSIEGIPVVGPREAFALLGEAAVVIVGVWSPQHAFTVTRDWLAFHGFGNVLPVQAAFWTAARTIGEHYQFGEPEPLVAAGPFAREVYDLLTDEESRRQFAGHMRWRLSLDSAYLPAGDRPRAYFGVPFLTISEDAAVVDVGAFDGDSLRSFLLWRQACRVYYALEPDPISYGRLQGFVASLPQDLARRIRPIQAASGATTSTLMVEPTGKPGSMVGIQTNDSQPVPCVSISDYFEGDHIDYIKFDIEGAEHDALAGAWDIIARDRPTIAVAIYHKPLDIVDIPLEIIRRTHDYRYYVRSHDDDGIDLVFYAVPASNASNLESN